MEERILGIKDMIEEMLFWPKKNVLFKKNFCPKHSVNIGHCGKTEFENKNRKGEEIQVKGTKIFSIKA